MLLLDLTSETNSALGRPDWGLYPSTPSLARLM